ncbi:MAG: hypothetical protein P9X22_07565, partial [Candidatus Zapsychrus exili]|nr:hypothetical protein [Candidatus Zapsychrus exili]
MDMIDLENTKFTFYGDLLGTAKLYNINEQLAKRKLDNFYDIVFNKFKTIESEEGIKGWLFSDSFFVTGTKLRKAIEIIGAIYYSLFHEDIYLRGAIVGGELEFDPKIELSNLTKQLPKTDVLFRAVTLEKSVKGIRFVIEKNLAIRMLPKEWLTDDLYKNNVTLEGYGKYDFRRKIVLSSEWHAYEYLWSFHLNPSELFSDGVAKFIRRLNISPYEVIEEKLLQVPKDVRIHLEETKGLLKRSSLRFVITDNALNLFNRQ